MKYCDIVEMVPPKEFNFEECLLFLNRSDLEVLHRVKDGAVYKVINSVLCKIGFDQNVINIQFPLGAPNAAMRQKAVDYVSEWFDLERDLGAFYHSVEKDPILKSLVEKYYGLRMMCIPDLFEALVWAVLGQQINLTFAYTLKKRFVEQFGEGVTYEGESFWLFPSYEKIALLSEDDLRKLQITSRKAEYIIGIAKSMRAGELKKENLLLKDVDGIRRDLLKIRGIGPWTADYVMMKSLHIPTAFPVADVGLHNALKNRLNFERKPSIVEIENYAENWEGWQAYATFYLWRSLYEDF